MSGETRKLQKVGGGTYTVSIPKEWATEQSLSAGETVRLYPDGEGTLVVCRADDETGTHSATVTVGDAGEAAAGTAGAGHATAEESSLERTLDAAYAAGVERLRLTASGEFDDDTRRIVQRLVRDRTGMQIVDEAPDAMAIRTMLDDREVSVQRTVVQLQFVTLSLFRTAVDLALDPAASASDRIGTRRAEASALAALVTRQFGRSLSQPAGAAVLDVGRSAGFECYRVARALDRMAALSATVAGHETGAPPGFAGVGASAGRLDEADRNALRSVADETRRYVEAATTATVEGGGQAAIRDLGETRSDLSAAVSETARLVEGEGAGRLLDRFRDVLACGHHIADVARERAIRRDG